LLRAFKAITIDRHRFADRRFKGMALYPEDGRHVDKLMRRADLGLCAAKRGGGGFLFVTP
jgi:GGDEF domain-containing protein